MKLRRIRKGKSYSYKLELNFDELFEIRLGLQLRLKEVEKLQKDALTYNESKDTKLYDESCAKYYTDRKIKLDNLLGEIHF